ncbi:MAG: transcriptional regulator, AraC family [Fibrobacteres bacterium]|nr:transcriptional regulator, AraC family [Fibrobacterota bacterium]
MTLAAVSEKDSRLNRVQWEAEVGVRLDLLGFVSFPRGHRGALHSHPFWELIFIGGGRGFLQRGEDVSKCEPEEILLVRPGEKHQFRTGDSDAFDQLYLGFSFDFAAPDSLSQSPPAALPDGPFTDLIRSELRDSLGRLKEENGRYPMESIRGRLLTVVSSVIGILIAPTGRANDPHHRQNDSTVRMAKDFIQANLKGRFGVPELARHFCLSPQYFGEIFKRDTGFSIKEYQRNCRMIKAMELLRETNLSITGISEEIGLDDVAYFSRIFRKQYGLPPSQVRSGSD